MKKISIPDDFVKDDDGDTILDSINVRLQTIGENLNKILKSEEAHLISDMGINPLPIVDFRNIVSHEYELLDYQMIFKICREEIPLLRQKIQTFLSNNNETV